MSSLKRFSVKVITFAVMALTVMQLVVQFLTSLNVPAVSISKSALFDDVNALNVLDKIAIRAVNPGYNTDAGKNAGELIELVNLTGEEIALDNLTVIYTAKPTVGNTVGKSTVLYHFPIGSKFVGESILMRYQFAPEAVEGSADIFYNTSLAMTGSLALVWTDADFDISQTGDNLEVSAYGEVASAVCWLGRDECLPIFSTTVKSRSYTTIVREPDTGEYIHVNNYVPVYSAENSGLYLPPESENTSNSFSGAYDSGIFDTSLDTQCQGLIFSEILSYYDEDMSEQFVEFYNSTSENLELLGCKIKYKSKYYALVEVATTLGAGEYYILRPMEFRLTKNPNTENVLELYDVNGTVVAKLAYPHGQKKGAAYALMGYNADGTENWQVTYAVTPGFANDYQQYRSCPVGKVINEATGNCVNVASMAKTLAECPAGKYRNPATGRCKSIDDDVGVTECKEGYERNPETNRCRKIKNNNGTEYPVVPISGVAEQTTFIALWAIGGVVVMGLIYIIFQFRKEIVYFVRKLGTKLKK